MNLLHSQRPKLYGVLTVLSAIGLRSRYVSKVDHFDLEVFLSPFSLEGNSYGQEFAPLETKLFLYKGLYKWRRDLLTRAANFTL